jgi:molybdenum cofactor biosynthesis enzyme
MSDSNIYAFEELPAELPRPPMAALRALFQTGVVVSPAGWQSVPLEVRSAFVLEGARGLVQVAAVKELLKRVPPRYLKLVPASSDPDPDQVPPALVKALGPTRPLSVTAWRSLRALDRCVLASLAANTRLLWRALDEILGHAGMPGARRDAKWTGALARCELMVRRSTLDRLLSTRFLDGRALVLARVAGIRSARKISDIFDLQAETASGPIELDWKLDRDKEAVLWQAHVSTWDGAFFPAASLLASTTAAAALCDMVKDFDPTCRIAEAALREEGWLVGGDAGPEEATVLYSMTPRGPVPAHVEDPADTERMGAILRELETYSQAAKAGDGGAGAAPVAIAAGPKVIPSPPAAGVSALVAADPVSGSAPVPVPLASPLSDDASRLQGPDSARRAAGPGSAVPSSLLDLAATSSRSSRGPLVLVVLAVVVFLCALVLFAWVMWSVRAVPR